MFHLTPNITTVYFDFIAFDVARIRIDGFIFSRIIANGLKVIQLFNLLLSWHD